MSWGFRPALPLTGDSERGFMSANRYTLSNDLCLTYVCTEAALYVKLTSDDKTSSPNCHFMTSKSLSDVTGDAV